MRQKSNKNSIETSNDNNKMNSNEKKNEGASSHKGTGKNKGEKKNDSENNNNKNKTKNNNKNNSNNNNKNKNSEKDRGDDTLAAASQDIIQYFRNQENGGIERIPPAPHQIPPDVTSETERAQSRQDPFGAHGIELGSLPPIEQGVAINHNSFDYGHGMRRPTTATRGIPRADSLPIMVAAYALSAANAENNRNNNNNMNMNNISRNNNNNNNNNNNSNNNNNNSNNNNNNYNVGSTLGTPENNNKFRVTIPNESNKNQIDNSDFSPTGQTPSQGQGNQGNQGKQGGQQTFSSLVTNLTLFDRFKRIIDELDDMPPSSVPISQMYPNYRNGNGISNSLCPPDVDPDSIPVGSDDEIDSQSGVSRQRVVIVCYQLPIKVSKNEDGSWNIEWHDIQDFLSNLRCLQKPMRDVCFVGWPGITPNTIEEQESLEDALYELKYPCFAVFTSETQRTLAYDVFCKSILWPLFHYLMPINDSHFAIEYERAWQQYCALNALYAKKASVATEGKYNKNTLIWFHNYHLLMAAHFLRKDLPTATIGLFVHTTFPTSEVFRCLPTRKEILRGMLAASLIGFHTYDYARHFLSSCKRVLDLDHHTMPGSGMISIPYLGRDVALHIGHVSIMSQNILKHVLSEDVRRIASEKWLPMFGKRKIIVGIAELDIVRGTLLVVQAYRRFLEMHNGWEKEVVFIDVISKSSGRLDLRRDLRNKVREEVNNIQKNYDQDCICLIEENLTYHELLALYTIADVGLFGTFWDGFNTRPYEFTAAQTCKAHIYNHHRSKLSTHFTPTSMISGSATISSHDIAPGVLILSEFMGCARSLAGVYRINPWQFDNVAQVIHAALLMTPEERRISHYRREHHVMTSTFKQWAERYLRDLSKQCKQDSDKRVFTIGLGSNAKFVYIHNDLQRLKDMERLLLSSFGQCKQKILLFDYGGTLTDIDERNPTNSSFSIYYSNLEMERTRHASLMRNKGKKRGNSKGSDNNKKRKFGLKRNSRLPRYNSVGNNRVPNGKLERNDLKENDNDDDNENENENENENDDNEDSILTEPEPSSLESLQKRNNTSDKPRNDFYFGHVIGDNENENDDINGSMSSSRDSSEDRPSTNAIEDEIDLDNDGSLLDLSEIGEFGGGLSYEFLRQNTLKIKKPSNEVLRLLGEISKDENVIICVISGHTVDEMHQVFENYPQFYLAAEKGAYYRCPWKSDEWSLNEKLDLTHIEAWHSIALRVLKVYTERTDGSYIQKKNTALVWHYHEADPQYGDMQATELEGYLHRILEPRYDVIIQRYDHARIIEILPKKIHKGYAALTMINNILNNWFVRDAFKMDNRMNGMTGMSGVNGMNGMSGMSGMNGMTSMSPMSGMSGLNNMNNNNMNNMNNMPRNHSMNSIEQFMTVSNSGNNVSNSNNGNNGINVPRLNGLNMSIYSPDLFVLCVGNDRSDEKMFEGVELGAKEMRTEHVYTVSIGIKPTQARFYLSDQTEIAWLLHTLETHSTQAVAARRQSHQSHQTNGARQRHYHNNRHNSLPRSNFGNDNSNNNNSNNNNYLYNNSRSRNYSVGGYERGQAAVSNIRIKNNENVNVNDRARRSTHELNDASPVGVGLGITRTRSLSHLSSESMSTTPM